VTSIDGPENARLRLIKHAMRSESARSLKAILDLAQKEPGIATRIEEFDADPWLFNCADSVLDLRTGTLLPHSPELLITHQSPVAINRKVPKEKADFWPRFLEGASGGDRDLQRFIQVAIGLALSGSTDEEIFFFICGPGATGKSTFVAAIRAVLGTYASMTEFDTFVQKPTGAIRNDLARLRGARAVFSVEVEDGRRLAEGLLKSVTGGDVITARYLYHESFEFKPQFKLFLVANDLPTVRAGDSGMWRRIRLIPFTNVIPPDQRDPDVKRKLTTDPDVQSAILQWAFEGVQIYLKDGLPQSGAVVEATNEYRSEMNPLGRFVASRCELGPGLRVETQALYSSYADWCIEYSEQKVPQNQVLGNLEQFGVEAVRGSKGKRFYANIRVR